MARDLDKLNEKVLKYEEFLNETLKTDLQRIVSSRDEVYKTMSEYLQLRNIIESLKATQLTEKPMKSMMDLGCNFYVQALVPDASTICVNVGLGYYAELTLDEALAFIKKRVEILERRSEIFTKEAIKIKAHVRMVLEGLRELQFFDTIREERELQ